jgi:alkanesulfonate monooxygenase SsuD/methylene tetrahydromethanopterin reductase-like flavin-dependent oxidoreductase (luciferase family)
MGFVAERGFNYAALTYSHVDAFPRNAAYFQETVARVDKSPFHPGMLGWLVPMYVAETDQKAREETEEHIWYLIHNLLKGFAGKGRTWMPPGYTSLQSLQRLQELSDPGSGHAAVKTWQLGHATSWDDIETGGSVLIGSPQTVREKLLQYVTEFKVGHILALPQFDSLPDLTRKNMELLANEVFPYVRKHAGAEFDTALQSPQGSVEQASAPA